MLTIDDIIFIRLGLETLISQYQVSNNQEDKELIAPNQEVINKLLVMERELLKSR
jgi:hypothetical protein